MTQQDSGTSLVATVDVLKSLEKSKHFREQLIYDLPNIVIVFDYQFRILWANGMTEHFIGAQRGMALGKSFETFFHEDAWMVMLERLQELSEQKNMVEFDLAARQDGKARHFSWVLRRVTGISERRGKVFQIIGHNVDTIKAMMDDVAKKNEELENYSHELSQLLSQVKEQQAKLANSSRLAQLGEMAGGIAHEINNPMNVIHGYAKIIEKKMQKAPDDSADFVLPKVRGIMKTVDRIAGIVKSMRLLARDAELDSLECCSVREVVETALSFVEERSRSLGIQIKVDDDLDVDFAGRKVQIAQIIVNLLNNAVFAVKHQEEKNIKIEIIKDELLVSICIEDSGTGIPEDIRDKIMQPFFTTKAAGEGTGLGLSISKTIALSHNGDLTLDPSCPKTRFILKLPLWERAADLAG